MKIDFKLPELGENINSGDVVKVLVHEGDVISGNDGVIELETDKAVVEIPCPHAGKIVKVQVAKGQTVKVGQTVLSIDTEESEEPPAKEQAAEAAAETSRPKGQGTAGDTTVTPKAAQPTTSHVAETLPAGPDARRVARELGVDLAQVRGSGKGGRITADDVRDAAHAAHGPSPMRAPGDAVVPPGEPGQDSYGPIVRERMSKIRRTIAAQMVKSATTVPHVTNFDDADVTDLERMRKSIPASYLPPNVKLTAMPFAMRAVALALRQHPVVNATIDDAKEEVVYKQYVNIGVAVDTPRGLVVPVVRNADQLGVPQLAGQLTSLAARAGRQSLPWRNSAAVPLRSATLAPLAEVTARRLSTIPRWPFCCSAGRGRCCEYTKARSSNG